MLAALADQWGLLLFRGVIAVLFGIAAFLWPGLTLVAMVALFGAYALLDGVAALVIAFQARGGPGFGSLLAEGIFGIAAAVVTFFYPRRERERVLLAQYAAESDLAAEKS